jgi:mannosyltransferase
MMSKRPPNTKIFLALCVAVGAAVRFANISQASIWHDEGYTLMLAPDGPLEILARTARDVHPPLYYLALHYWLQAFGTSELAARSLSAVLMLGTIVVGYFLVKRLFDERTARLAAVFLTLGPFLVRYSQEARMYGMVAFLLTLATFWVVRIVQERKPVDYVWYTLTLAAALYTHYYAIFIIPVHWLYMLTVSLGPKWRWRPGHGVLDWRWWTANIGALALFAPWLPVAYAQFTRVQSAFWIPAPSVHTILGTIAQFLTFTDMGQIPFALLLLLFAAVTGLILAALWAHQAKWRELMLLISFASFGPLAVLVLSLKRPIYVDRYFVFAAAAFYMLLAVMVYFVWPWSKQLWLRKATIAVLVVTFLIGISNVYNQATHQMRYIGELVSQAYRPGDEIVSGELYTYFDFSYYNHTGHLLKLLEPDGVTGYGESSLLYDRADQIVVQNYTELHPASGHVWVIGKTGQHDYFDDVPGNWTPIGPHYTAGYSAAQEYAVTPQ